MKMHSPHFIATLARAARERGVLLIADEVAVGFGRTGTLFASEQVGVEPDLLCVAKGLAAGYLPLAATLATERLFDDFVAEPHAGRHLFHGHTFSGNPLACAVALESLTLFDRNDVLAHVALLGAVLEDSLNELRALPTVHAIRRNGVMVGIDVRQSDGAPFDPALRMGQRIAMACRSHGAIVRPLGDTLILNPPLAITEPEARRLVATLAEALADVD
jgi:adenosylmethionine-8-amino-7-oxononanoate aminotransferase